MARRAGIALVVTLVAGVALLPAGPVPAEVTISGGGSFGWGRANADSTRNVERWITGAARFCGSYHARWRVDCLRDQYRQVVPRLPRTGPYAAVAVALSAAADELDSIAAREADPARAPARLTEGGGRQSAGTVRATAPARQNSANRAAAAVIDRLATQLLRSAPAGATRDFAALSRAAEGAKTLLRSG
ncbi:hypothetical protein [Szabonella alba]|uniref:Uncharacterized protein n=1 Tax=Szabonella alba TaxID=2804194 RepID=A0A8K0VBL2_9RHOB|nr:hypothetical protein [Szabonella alba]MBL4919087.1 hypothetical protein [Szabonella alba]